MELSADQREGNETHWMPQIKEVSWKDCGFNFLWNGYVSIFFWVSSEWENNKKKTLFTIADIKHRNILKKGSKNALRINNNRIPF